MITKSVLTAIPSSRLVPFSFRLYMQVWPGPNALMVLQVPPGNNEKSIAFLFFIFVTR